MQVRTGALDDGRGFLRQLVLAVLGWALTIGLVLWLAFQGEEIALRISLFLLSVSVFVAIVAVAFAVVVFRPALVRGRTRELGPAAPAPQLDALGRPLPTGLRPDLLEGEIAIEGDGSGRRYASRGAVG